MIKLPKQHTGLPAVHSKLSSGLWRMIGGQYFAERTYRYADMGNMCAFYEALKAVYGPSHQIQATLCSLDKTTLTIIIITLNREDCWGTADDFTTSVLHFSLFSTALWDLENSRPVHSLMLGPCKMICTNCRQHWLSRYSAMLTWVTCAPSMRH